MKIGFISDLHLGFGKEKEIYEDVLKIGKNIILELSKICDVIFIAGDLFDEKNPDNETILETIKIFKSIEKKEEKISFKINGKKKEERIPVIFAIHGNHDRKFKDEISIYRIFDELEIFHYIPYGKIQFEDKKIVIYAMSNVPERFAKRILYEKLNPKPIENYFNILVLHQNIYPFVYSVEDSSLRITDLPRNFNLIVNGHIHLRNEENLNGTKLLFLGSPIVTRLSREEINEKRGYNIIEILDQKNFNLIFKEIEQERKYYIIEVDTNEFKTQFLEKTLNEIIFNSKQKPVIKIKLFGKKEIEEKMIKEVINKFEEKAIIKIENLVEDEKYILTSKTIELIQEKKSIDEILLNTILERLKERRFSNSFNFQKLIELFEDGDVDTLVDILVKTQKTLES